MLFWCFQERSQINPSPATGCTTLTERHTWGWRTPFFFSWKPELMAHGHRDLLVKANTIPGSLPEALLIFLIKVSVISVPSYASCFWCIDYQCPLLTMLPKVLLAFYRSQHTALQLEFELKKEWNKPFVSGIDGIGNGGEPNWRLQRNIIERTVLIIFLITHEITFSLQDLSWVAND